MTLIVGIISNGGIVMAADSQTSHYPYKQTGTQKIRVMEFGKVKALVAEAGLAPLSNRAIQLLEMKAESFMPSGDDAVARIVADAVREAANEHILAFGREVSMEERKDYFMHEDTSFNLMVAYYHGSDPYIFTVRGAWCIPEKANGFFATAGTGGVFAHYFLRQFATAGMTINLAIAMAVYVAELVLKIDMLCDHPVNVAGLSLPYIFHPNQAPDSVAKILDHKEVSEITAIVSEVDTKLQTERAAQISAELSSRTQKKIENLFKELTSKADTSRDYSRPVQS